MFCNFCYNSIYCRTNRNKCRRFNCFEMVRMELLPSFPISIRKFIVIWPNFQTFSNSYCIKPYIFRANWEVRLTEENLRVIPTNATLNDVDGLDSVKNNRMNYVYIYTVLITISLFLVFQRALALFIFCLKASRRIHENMLSSVVRAKMYFFHTNTSGRIINRFSKDFCDVDYYLAFTLYDFTMVSGAV